MKDQRERARELYQDQLTMVADKKRAAILRDLTTQREESEMLERTKRAYVNILLEYSLKSLLYLSVDFMQIC